MLRFTLFLALTFTFAHAARADAPPSTTPDTPPAPLDTPTPPTPPPAPPTEPADVPRTPVKPAPAATVRYDAAAEDVYKACQSLLDKKEVDEAEKCYRDVASRFHGTEAALKADAALFVLDAHLKPATPEGIIPAGRLGITTATGLFGAWNAIAAGVVINNSTNGSLPPGALILGTGVGAVVLGVAGGAGGYFLADSLKLDEGAARLVGSSLVWGTAIGAALAPSAYQLISGPNASNNSVAAGNAAVGVVVASGYLFGGAALLVASNVKLDEAQVGLINSGGIVGSEIGVIAMIDVAAATANGGNGGGFYPYTAAYVISTGAGIAAGAALGQWLDMTWGEVLLCDLGGVLGLIGGGAAGFAIALAASQNGGGTTPVYLMTSAAGVGVLAGYGAGIAIVETWRKSRGAPLIRGGPDVQPTAVSLLDFRGRPVAGLGLSGSF